MDKRKPFPINPELKEYAVKMRKNMTNEEKKVWYQILKGCVPKFHRQIIIGNYIVDFYIASSKLVIELDGSQHYDPDLHQKDVIRDQWLHNAGYTVLRYSNEDINQRFFRVCEDILNHIEEHKL